MKTILTSESVTRGHPDKVCDQISDAILDAILAQDPEAHVACEVTAWTDNVNIMGEVTAAAHPDYEAIARRVIRDIGYDKPGVGFDANSCRVSVNLHTQSPDIAQGVDHKAQEDTGAGDQGMMFGYACRETEDLMPLPITLAVRLAKRLEQVRRDGTLPWLLPDGKSQVSVEYEDGKPVRIATVVISAQHSASVPTETLREAIRREVIDPALPEELVDEETAYFINPTGRFVIGGPAGDSGLTGRKIIADTYGGAARHGGGAFSGKDPTKVDRSATYAARYAAKNIVAAGLADKVEIQLAYAIGVAKPVSILVDTFGTGKIDDEKIAELVEKNFDLRPAAIIRDLDLRRPIYKQTAAYGHFGRTDVDLPWEHTDKAETLRQQAGL